MYILHSWWVFQVDMTDNQALEMPIPKEKLFQDKRRCCMLERDGTRKAFIVKRIL